MEKKITSWLRADTSVRQSNFKDGQRMKCLVPKEYGGGYILGKYLLGGKMEREDNKEVVDLNDFEWKLKLVTPSYNESYETCPYYSHEDKYSNGLVKIYWYSMEELSGGDLDDEVRAMVKERKDNYRM